MSYSIRLFDANLSLLRQLDGAASVSVRRRPNSAATANYSYPSDDEATANFTLARNLAIYRAGVQKFTGRITSRNADSRELSLEAIGHEDRLARLKTPRNWQGWNGLDLADFVRDVLRQFRFRRFSAQSDWQGARASANVDVVTEPGSVMLARQAYLTGQQFVASGWIELRLDLGAAAQATGRVARWTERVGSAVRTTIQSRSAADEVALNGTAYGAEMTAVNNGDTQNNETTGVDLASTGRWLDVRVNLYTADQTTPDSQEDPRHYGFTPILDGLEVVWREAGPIQEGTIPVGTGVGPRDLKWDRENHLKVLADLCERFGWEFRVRHDEAAKTLKLDLAQAFGTDLSGTVVLRESDTCSITTLRDSDDGYCNVLDCWGSGQGADRLYLQLRNEAAIGAFGEEVSDDFEYDTDNPVELQTKGQTELDKRSAVASQFAVVAYPDDSWPDVNVGDTVKVVDGRSGYVSNARILDEQREYGADGERISLGLGKYLDNPLEALILAQRKASPDELDAVPPAPNHLRVIGQPNSIRLAWIGAADAWDLERTNETDAGGNPINWKRLATTYEPGYTDGGLVLGSIWWYRIRSRRGGRASAWVQAKGIAKDVIPPAAPTGLAVSVGPDKLVRLSWTPDPDVAEYQIWRRDGSFPADPTGAVMIAEEQGNSHIDTTGAYSSAYTWFLKAVDAAENVSAFSLGISATLPAPPATGPDTTPPGSLAAVALTVDQGSLYQDGQGNWFVRCLVSLTGIPVDAKRAYIQLKHAQASTVDMHLDDQIEIASGNASVAIDDLLPGVQYNFEATPISYYGVSGTPATGSQTMTTAIPDPAVPTGLTVTTGPGKTARLSWNASAEMDVNEYEVWRRDGTWPADPTGAVKLAEEAGTTHVDTTGNTGSTYTWFVKAVRRSGKVSGYSTGAAATIPFTEPDPSVPASLAGVTLTPANYGQTNDAQGNIIMSARLTLSGIPGDLKRAYIQIAYRRPGVSEWKLEDQIADSDITWAGTGSVTAYVDDLLPGVLYEFAAIPVSYFGVQGTPETAQLTISGDTWAPATPTVSARAVLKGVEVTISANAELDWAENEVFVATTNASPPTGWNGAQWTGVPNDPGAWTGAAAANLKDRGRKTVFRFELTPGTNYYVAVVARDYSGNRSAPSAWSAAVDPSLVNTPDIANQAISELTAYVVNDDAGTSTTSTSYVDIPGFSVSFTLVETAALLILMTGSVQIIDTDLGGSAGFYAYFMLNIDNVDETSDERYVGITTTSAVLLGQAGAITMATIKSLGPGSHTIKGRFYTKWAGSTAMIHDRTLAVLIFKR